ncbi:MAG: hypothetical protein MJ142_07870, partial [Clostridia bacterium]|nr:hypothetical protein [Clostridia bacterium]
PEETEPEVKPEETEPEVKPEETEPEVKPEETEPEVKPEETEPEVKPEETEPEVKPEETEPETEPEEGESTVAPISLSAQDIETVPVQGAAFEVVDSDETLSPLEGSIDVTALQTVADKQYAVGPFRVAGNMIISFRISMIHEGNEVKLDRKIRVSIPVTEEQAAKLANSILYLCAENDNLIPISYEIIDSRIEFETDSLGTFVFIDSDVINTRN